MDYAVARLDVRLDHTCIVHPDLIGSRIPLTLTALPSTVFTSPLGSWQSLHHEPWYVKILVSVSRFSGCNNLARVPLGKAANARQSERNCKGALFWRLSAGAVAFNAEVSVVKNY